jgi:hypothetical protein
MSRTAADVRQTVVPSSLLLPNAHVGFSIVTKPLHSREFFNGIGPDSRLKNELHPPHANDFLNYDPSAEFAKSSPSSSGHDAIPDR